eukprot:1278981-Alexandrium_andersonii.AAC.1
MPSLHARGECATGSTHRLRTLSAQQSPPTPEFVCGSPSRESLDHCAGGLWGGGELPSELPSCIMKYRLTWQKQ